MAKTRGGLILDRPLEKRLAAAPFSIKAIDGMQRVIEGYAAFIGNRDTYDDIIAPGAFKTTLVKKQPQDVAVFIGHNMAMLPVGVPISIQEDKNGLLTRTKIFESSVGDDLLITAKGLLDAGSTLGMSIGFYTDQFDNKILDGHSVRMLTGIDLVEYSFAAKQVVANSRALVASVKSLWAVGEYPMKSKQKRGQASGQAGRDEQAYDEAYDPDSPFGNKANDDMSDDGGMSGDDGSDDDGNYDNGDMDDAGTPTVHAHPHTHPGMGGRTHSHRHMHDAEVETDDDDHDDLTHRHSHQPPPDSDDTDDTDDTDDSGSDDDSSMGSPADSNEDYDPDDAQEGKTRRKAMSKMASPVHHTKTNTEAPWDGGAAVSRAPSKASVLAYMHAWRDSNGDPDLKSSYKLPHHEPRTGGAAVIAGVNNALARLSSTKIPASDKAGVKAHLEAHRKDAGLDTSEKAADLQIAFIIQTLQKTMVGVIGDALAAKRMGIKSRRTISRAHLSMLHDALTKMSALHDAQCDMGDRCPLNTTDPDNDGDDDSSPTGDTDHDFAGAPAAGVDSGIEKATKTADLSAGKPADKSADDYRALLRGNGR